MLLVLFKCKTWAEIPITHNSISLTSLGRRVICESEKLFCNWPTDNYCFLFVGQNQMIKAAISWWHGWRLLLGMCCVLITSQYCSHLAHRDHLSRVTVAFERSISSIGVRQYMVLRRIAVGSTVSLRNTISWNSCDILIDNNWAV